jgi:predicted DNA-binding antitoxin AbrB/MazE fold protein
MASMTATLEAIYENGTLKLSRALPLPEKSRVTVTVATGEPAGADVVRAEWLRESEERLTQTWDNPDDDVFNELLKK